MHCSHRTVTEFKRRSIAGVYTRSMSWDWMSSDGGATWLDLQGLTPLSIEQHEFGDEGDIAADDGARPGLAVSTLAIRRRVNGKLCYERTTVLRPVSSAMNSALQVGVFTPTECRA